jgi:hypothetical protein
VFLDASADRQIGRDGALIQRARPKRRAMTKLDARD